MIEQTKNRIRKMVADRDWNQYHTPANLAKSISIEANELLECFQWDDKNFDLHQVKAIFCHRVVRRIALGYFKFSDVL